MATQNANLDAWFADTLGGAGNGKGDRMAVGMGTSGWNWSNRFAIRIPRSNLFDGITAESQITAFNVKLRVAGGLFNIGANVKFWLERGTTTFTENSEARREFVNTSGGANSEWPGPTRTTTNRVKYEGSPATGDWITVPMLAMGKQFYTQGWTELILVGIAADATTGYDEANTARGCVFQTREGATPPYVEVNATTNQAPDMATDLDPTGGETFGSTDGAHLTMTARYSDPNGDPSNRSEWYVYPDSSTDGSLGTAITSLSSLATVASGSLKSVTVSVPGITPPVFVKWRMRFRDSNDTYGPWTLLQRVQLAYDILSPAQPTVTPGTLDPDFFASLISGDPNDFITAGQVWVYQDPAQGQTITKWDSGKTAISGTSNRMQLPYGGSALNWGTQYRWRVQLWNQSDVASPQSGDLYFTPVEATGPNIVPGDLNTKQNTRTPTFTLTDQSGQSIDQYRMRFYSPTGTLLHDTNVVSQTAATSANVTTPTGLWDWGQEPLVDAAIRITGNPTIGPFSEQRRIHINAKPGSPYPLSVTHASAQVVLRTDGVYIADTATPTVVLPFRDTDKDLGYTEAPTRREVEIRNMADAHVSSSPYIITSGITNNYVTPTLAAETTYKVRGRYDDNANVRSDFSDYVFLKRSAAPTLTSVTPANAATVTDPTPTIAWTFNSAGGKAQQFYRLTASVAGDEVYNSGLVEETTSTVNIGANVLPNSSSVDWTLQVWDTDGLSVTLTRTFTTNFTQPAAITGLTVTADDDAKALLVAWTESALSADEFEAYYVEARTSNTQWQRVATITDKAEVSYTYRGAAHNTDVSVRVIQTNGWMDSEPTEAVGEIVAEGYWWLRPEPLHLRYVRVGDFSAAPLTLTEEFEPRGASSFIVLTWESYGVRWDIQMLQPAEDRSVYDALWSDMRSGRVGILKTPDGGVYYSKLRSVPFTHGPVGHYDVPLSGTEVSYTEATF